VASLGNLWQLLAQLWFMLHFMPHFVVLIGLFCFGGFACEFCFMGLWLLVATIFIEAIVKQLCILFVRQALCLCCFVFCFVYSSNLIYILALRLLSFVS